MELPGDRFRVEFDEDSRLALTTRDVPTETENAPIVGEAVLHDLYALKDMRPNVVAFKLAKLTLETKLLDAEDHQRPWLFPQVLAATKRWLAECLTCHDDTFPQLLVLTRHAHNAAEHISRSLKPVTDGEPALLAVPRAFDVMGSTRFVDFDTVKPTWPTRADKCQVSHVVADTETWEQKAAQAIEDMDEVIAYVKNHGLGFTIPYMLEGDERQYHPDFIILLDDGHGREDPLRLILETTGERKKDKVAKVSTARNLWVPAVNGHGGWGRWEFLECTDPWNLKTLIRGRLRRVVPA
jgi:type III restriction enzyme